MTSLLVLAELVGGAWYWRRRSRSASSDGLNTGNTPLVLQPLTQVLDGLLTLLQTIPRHDVTSGCPKSRRREEFVESTSLSAWSSSVN